MFCVHTGDARAVADSSRGIRSIRFSPDGQHVAVGDRAGNLKYVTISTNSFVKVTIISYY